MWTNRPSRSLGPIEFLCVWRLQQGAHGPLTRQDFEYALVSLLTLFNTEPKSAQLYCAKLQDDLDNPLEGAFSRQARAMIQSLVIAWRAGKSPADVVAACTTQSDSGSAFGLPGWRP